MFDAALRPWIDPALDRAGRRIARWGVSADGMTLVGLGIGLGGAGAAAVGAFWLALALIVASRLADGLDGAIARATRTTDFGGFLDISADFLFYGAVPFAFVLHAPEANGLAGAFLVATFYVNGSTFLAYAVLAERRRLSSTARGTKNLFYSGGLLEGTETITLFVLFCVFPDTFPLLAWGFGALTLVTASGRVAGAWINFRAG